METCLPLVCIIIIIINTSSKWSDMVYQLFTRQMMMTVQISVVYELLWHNKMQGKHREITKYICKYKHNFLLVHRNYTSDFG